MVIFTFIIQVVVVIAAVNVGWVKHGPPSVVIWLALADLAFVLLYLRKISEDWQFLRSQPRAWLRVQWKEWGEPFLIAALLAFVIRSFILGPYKIPTGSMIPTFMIGDRIFVDKVSYRLHPPERGDIIVFKYPLDRKKDFVKRLVGLPGDRIEIREGKLLVNGKAMEDPPFSEHYYYNHEDWEYGKTGQIIIVPPRSLFALGDNSAQSSDSRNWGFVPQKDLIGKAILIWWPLQRIKLVR